MLIRVSCINIKIINTDRLRILSQLNIIEITGFFINIMNYNKVINYLDLVKLSTWKLDALAVFESHLRV